MLTAPRPPRCRQNKDPDSPFWDFKFSLKSMDIDYDRLRAGQVVNHFDNNTQLTRKVGRQRRLSLRSRCHRRPQVGLMHNLRTLGRYADSDISQCVSPPRATWHGLVFTRPQLVPEMLRSRAPG